MKEGHSETLLASERQDQFCIFPREVVFYVEARRTKTKKNDSSHHRPRTKRGHGERIKKAIRVFYWPVQWVDNGF